MKKTELKVTLGTLGHVIALITNAIRDGVTLRVTIQKWVDRRSLSQNATYWMWLEEICRQIKEKIGEDHDKETLHDIIKDSYCPPKVISVAGLEREIKSTRLLDKGEMTHYMMKVEKWAIWKGFKLTTPINCEYRELMERQEQ